MAADLSVTFTGLRFENPFLLSSAPPTESDSNIMRAFDAGWGGVVTKTIGLHPVANVAGPKTKFLRATADSYEITMQKRPGSALHSSWNWELISDKPLDWWLPRLARIKQAHPDRILVASIMAGSGNDRELRNWQTLATACQDAGADAFELNLSCPHMDRKDMGSNIGQDEGLISVVTQVVKDVATGSGVVQDHAVDDRHRRRGARVVSRRRGRHRVVEHVPVDSADRSGHAGVRGQRRRARLERRARRSGDPAAVARQGRADDAGLPRSRVLGDRRHRGVRARAELFPPGMRHRAGLHRGDARPRDRVHHHQGAHRRAARRSSTSTRIGDGARSRTSAACAAIASCRTRRSGGPNRRSTSAATTRRKDTRRPLETKG